MYMEFRITFHKIMIGDEVKSSHQFSKYTFIYWLQDNLIIEKKQLTKIYDQSIHFTDF